MKSERGRKEPDHVGPSPKGKGNSLKRMLPLTVVPALFIVYERPGLPCASAENIAGHEPSSVKGGSAEQAFMQLAPA